MSSVGEKIEHRFPEVQFTGQSPRHRSLAGRLQLKGTFDNEKQLMTAVYHAKLGDFLWEYYHEAFPELNWQVSQEEFTMIVLVDVYRHLMKQGDSKLATKIKNPSTGNVFHRLATLDDMVGGIRLWNGHNDQTNDGEGCTEWGFRFRIAGLNDETEDGETETTETLGVKVRVKVVQTEIEAEQIIAHLELAEPTPKKIRAAKTRVHICN